MILLETRPGRIERRAYCEGGVAFRQHHEVLIMGTSSNFGNMFSMAAASLFLPFLPMLPTQILLNNFLYDIRRSAFPATMSIPPCFTGPSDGRSRSFASL